MLLNIFSILFLIFFTIIIIDGIEKKIFKNILILIFSLIIILQLSSIYYLNDLINYRFLNFFQIAYSLDFFIQTKLMTLLTFLLFFFLLIFFKKFKIPKFSYKQKCKNYFLILSLIIFLLPKNGIIRNIYNFYFFKDLNISKLEKNKNQNLFGSNSDFDDILKKINLKNYKNKKNLYSKNGNNIIFITIESVDSSFIREFDLTYLNNLKATNKYIEFNDTDYIKNSIEYLYSMINGVPLSVLNLENYFENIKINKLTNIGDVFRKSNYNSKFFIGDADFTGIRSFMELSNFKVLDKSDFVNVQKYNWGVHDSDLFNELKKHILKSKQNHNNQKFALFVNTFNTHLEGISDPAYKCGFFEKKIKCASKNIEFQIKELISFLKFNQMFKNTTIFIANDHKSMSIKNSDAKNYLIVINSKNKKKYKKKTKSQLDLPRLIIDESGIETNVKFLSDYEKVNFNNKLTQQLISSSLVFHENINGISIELKDNFLYLRTIDEGKILSKYKLENNNSDNFTSLIIDDQYRVLHYQSSNNIIKYKNPSKKNINQIIVHSKGKNIINASTQNLVNYDVKKLNFRKNVIKFTLNEKRQDLYKNYKHFIAHAGGKYEDIIYSNSLEAINYSHNIGFKKIELDLQFTSDGKLVAVHDWQEWKNRTSYKGKIPPTHNDFMSFKQFDRLTPLDLKLINSWFKKNQDTYLITDKIKNINFMLKNFTDPNRLFMEIFSIESLIEARNNNFNNTLINYSLLENFYFKKSKLDFIKEFKIKNIALPATVYEEKNQFYLKKIKNKLLNKYYFHEVIDLDINFYFFHINYRNNNQENKFYCTKMRGNHTIYVDDWKFVKPKC